MSNWVDLPANTNQALGIGKFATDFMSSSLGTGPSSAVLARTSLFHADAVLCGFSALALATNAPTILRSEALDYPDAEGGFVFGSSTPSKAEKAIVANAAAVREWDSNGTNFGYNPSLGHVAGEFGHNDFYSVPVVACQQRDLGGDTALRGMVLVDEIRGRLSEVFSLKSYKIDHVVFGAIASAATYGAIHGASPEQIESAIGMFVAHYIPWRAIRAGKQLSDSKGASAALSTEAAVLSMKRSLAGFVGPKDIFRNPESLFRQFEPTSGDSPFNLSLSHSGDDFAVSGMHFKIGLYEHQSAGGIQAVLDLLGRYPHLRNLDQISSVLVRAYEPAFGIIGDPAKRNPQTRQSADHSMVYILARVIRKAAGALDVPTWENTMLLPDDFGQGALNDRETRSLLGRIEFEHGGPEYDSKYPDGIPTSVVITDREGKRFDSGLVMYPAGHARNTAHELSGLLNRKFENLGAIAFDSPVQLRSSISQLENLPNLSPSELRQLYNFPIAMKPPID